MSSVSGFGKFPIANLVVLEVGLATGLIALAINANLLPVATAIAVVAMIIAFSRIRGKWGTQWLSLLAGYAMRKRNIAVHPQTADQGLTLLHMLVPDLVVVSGVDHEGNDLGLAWHSNAWTVLLRIEAPPQLVTPVGSAPRLPLSVLMGCMRDRGVVLDSIQVTWHGSTTNAALLNTSPALAAYLEVVGSIPVSAHGSTVLAVRLDPRRCPAAVEERGSGVIGAHKALIASVARIRSALSTRGIVAKPLTEAELIETGITSAELVGALGKNAPTESNETWRRLTAAGIGHSSYAITRWPSANGDTTIDALTSLGGLSSTVALVITPGTELGQARLRGLVRVSARHPDELGQSEKQLEQVSTRLGLTVTPLRGQQLAGLAATLPFGGTR